MAEKVAVTLKDGSKREYPSGITVYQVAEDISKRLARAAIAAKVNGKLVDLSTLLQADAELEILTFDDPEGQEVFRHSAAHVLAQAVKRLFPEAKLGIGPAIENGFYYDFDVDRPFNPEDLERIEAEMQRIVSEGQEFERQVLSRDEAIDFFKEHNEPYKVELIKELPEDAEISLYQQGEFIDLCAGPHVPSTSVLKAFKLLSVAGAYWRGSESNPMLQRIYGTAWRKKSQLEEYLNMLEEAKKRDHRRLGRELDLFSFHSCAPGFPFFHAKGVVIINELIDFWRIKHKQHGYVEIKSPIIMNRSLWEQSGHWDHYRENMYFTEIDEQPYAVKPMNCPGSILVYKTDLHSYRELPIRMCELGLVHRHELSGVLHGLMRVRAFTQDDAHLYMTPEQVEQELKGVLDLVDEMYTTFGFDYHVELSTRPEKAMGTKEMWDKAENTLKKVLEDKGVNYLINEGDGAFYGPKIDFHIKDSLGRSWQCGTVQLDFQMPEKFELEYVGDDGEKHRPVMIHRTVYGSLERFLGVLVEHFAGAFPTWLAPVQVTLIPITDRHHAYARSLAQRLEQHGVRVEVDDRNEKMGFKIREAQLQKVPYMLVVGDKEAETQSVAVRHRRDGDLGTRSFEEFVDDLLAEIRERRLG